MIRKQDIIKYTSDEIGSLEFPRKTIAIELKNVKVDAYGNVYVGRPYRGNPGNVLIRRTKTKSSGETCVNKYLNTDTGVIKYFKKSICKEIPVVVTSSGNVYAGKGHIGEEVIVLISRR